MFRSETKNRIRISKNKPDAKALGLMVLAENTEKDSDAIAYLGQAMALLGKHPVKLDAFLLLARRLQRSEQTERAAGVLKDALEWTEVIFGIVDTETLEVRRRFVQIHRFLVGGGHSTERDEKYAAKAKEIYDDAIKRSRKIPEAKCILQAELAILLSELMFQEDKAQALLLEARDGFAKFQHKLPPKMIATALMHLAILIRVNGDEADAHIYIDEATAILKSDSSLAEHFYMGLEKFLATEMLGVRSRYLV